MKQILCFGDSNTYGLVPGSKDRYQWGERWTSIVDSYFQKSGYRVIEEGLCGRTTIFEDPLRDGRNASKVLPILLETHKPIEVVILMLGTNDCKAIYDASEEVIGLGIHKLLDQIEEGAPKSKIILVSPIELGNRIWEEEFDPEFNGKSVGTSKKLSSIYGNIADERKIAFLNASWFVKASRIDREHMDLEAHRIFAEALIHKMEEVI